MVGVLVGVAVDEAAAVELGAKVELAIGVLDGAPMTARGGAIGMVALKLALLLQKLVFW